MHYADGREVKVGDLVISTPPYEGSAQVLGTVVSGQPKQDSCNVNIAPLATRHRSPLGFSAWIPFQASGAWSANAKDCTKVDAPGDAPPVPA